jgi:hypothetical protein
MKDKFILIAIILIIGSLVCAGPPQGQPHKLQERVVALEIEVACLESYVNYILSDEYVEWLLSQIEE